ncbi:hypothetical protein CEXT_29651 [Caerostris extrusa]|uniref:Uncharacterized protein n=1 Tax=Caerostris extrusa TaxID=172846 RepID=A0AAV4U5T2_CAEEX|nr:hypothetical protein CEXT_29651 [Caerostris extrusa]
MIEHPDGTSITPRSTSGLLMVMNSGRQLPSFTYNEDVRASARNKRCGSLVRGVVYRCRTRYRDSPLTGYWSNRRREKAAAERSTLHAPHPYFGIPGLPLANNNLANGRQFFFLIWLIFEDCFLFEVDWKENLLTSCDER